MTALEELEASINRDPLAIRLAALDISTAHRFTWDSTTAAVPRARVGNARWRLALVLAALALVALATPVAATSGTVVIQALHQVTSTVEHDLGITRPSPSTPVTPHGLSQPARSSTSAASPASDAGK